MLEVTVRIYGPLNDFLTPARRQVTGRIVLKRRAAVKDVVEAIGVPHPEIDLVLVDGSPVRFDYVVRSGDRIAVFPRFVSLDIDALSRVRVTPPEPIRFVADVHLGALARRLRLAGFDTAYRNDAGDADLAQISAREQRVLLTRDQALLKRSIVAHGCFLRATRPHDQLVEVLRRFGPLPIRPFSRCTRCNGVLRDVPKAEVDAALLPRTRAYYDRFRRCAACGRVYWQGSHWRRLTRALEAARADAEGTGG
ncbi:MAG: Mut7-C RNAse domain-containing protein [Betaproteobacteria bacterium]